MREKITQIVILLIISTMSTLAQNTFIDNRDNKTYETIVIGKQTWMAENLNYKTDENSWTYDDNMYNSNEYGRLYTWEIATEICPDGWHLPSNNEWEELLIYLDNGMGKCQDGQYMVANKLIKKGLVFFNYRKKLHLKNPMINNKSGFSAIPSGLRDPYGKYYYLGEEIYFWSSSKKVDEKYGFDDHYYFVISIEGIQKGVVVRKKTDAPSAFPIRCIKD